MKNKKSLGKILSSICRHRTIIVNQELKGLDLGTGQHMFLINIANKEGVNLKELSKMLNIDKANTTRAVKKLENVGYIESRINSTDKRNQNLYLTEKGREILPELREKLYVLTDILTRDLSEEDVEKLFELLEKLETNIIEEVEERRK